MRAVTVAVCLTLPFSPFPLPAQGRPTYQQQMQENQRGSSTTATLLARAIIREGIKLLAAGIPAMELRTPHYILSSRSAFKYAIFSR